MRYLLFSLLLLSSCEIEYTDNESDGKFFKFNVWDAGYNNGYIFEDKFIIEVKQVTKIAYE